MWFKIVTIAFVFLLSSIAAALLYGTWRWHTGTTAVMARLHASRSVPRGLRFDAAEIEGLPHPAARYFRTVLHSGQPIVVGARLVQQGGFRTGDANGGWQPFTATQAVSTWPPGFVWDARIRVAPGLRVHVRDAYVIGAGSMHAAVLGLVPVINAHDTPELAAGALQRYLAEAVWLPTALLPSQGVQWAPIDDSTARATLTHGGTTVSLEFRFNTEGEIVGAFTPSRYREVEGAYEPTPWECRYTTYIERDGMRIPLEGEVEWHLATHRLPYWRGRIREITYEYAP
jgi:hypothetical protein